MQSFSQRILAWYELHGRKHLPWQKTPTAYSTWVSEIMLQQTQVTTVIPYFNRFMMRFPNVVTLANADTDEVLSHWAGLGYYSRARNLHKASQIIRDQHSAIFPDDFSHVIKLPGIGKSTAGAILSLSLNKRHVILDGNVKRVLSRHQLINGIPNQSKTLEKQWLIAKSFTPKNHFKKYTQAIMDMGAIICTKSKPKCNTCPISTDCGALKTNQIKEYPNKKPKKKIPEKHTTMLIITDGSYYYLEKRPNQGIWGGMWSLPEIPNNNMGENPETLINQFFKRKSLIFLAQKEQKTFKHTFSHYRLHISPILIHVEHLNNGFSPKKYADMALPTPIRKILDSVC